jgi:integrase
VYGKTKREAQDKLRTAMAAVLRGERTPDQRRTTAAWLETWLEATVRPHLRSQTVESYEATIRRYIAPSIGRVPVARLTPDDVTRMLADVKRRGLTPRTQRYALTVLRAALQRGLEAGVVTRNVAKLVHPPKQDREERRPFTVEQVAALFEASADDPIGPLVVLSASTGLRQGEALGLRWDDIDLEAGVLSVRHTLDVTTRQLAPTKTDRSRRVIHLPAVALAAIREQRRRQLEDRLRAGARWHGDGFVFASKLGTALDARNVIHRYHAIRERAGLPNLPWHHLRHFAATALLEAGEDLFVVSRILGHTSIATTASFYGHVRPAMLRRSADRMDELLGHTSTG